MILGTKACLVELFFLPANVYCNSASSLQSSDTSLGPFISWESRKYINVLHGALNQHFCDCCCKTERRQQYQSLHANNRACSHTSVEVGVHFAYPKLASIWNGGCAVNKLLYNPPSKSPSWSGSTRLISCLTNLYACSLLWRRAHRAIFHVVDHPGPISPALDRKLKFNLSIINMSIN